MKIWAYGDSFVAGDQDIPGRIDAIKEHADYNKDNISFISHLANMLEIEYVNRAVSGSGNFPQVDKLLTDTRSFEKQDIILFGITSTWRDRFSLPTQYPAILEKNRGPFLIDLDLYESKSFDLIPIFDLLYVTNMLDAIEKNYGIRIFKFNCFHDVYIESDEHFKNFFNPSNYIGFGKIGNTLTDILMDSWDRDSKSNHDHAAIKISKNQKRFFTVKNHPSLLGHKKLAEWFYNYLKNNKIV
jgi:hypothetical protein